MHIAARRGLVECVKALVKTGADVNAVARGDITPLLVAEAQIDLPQREEVVKILIQR